MPIRIAGETVGARGIALLAVTAVAGAALAVHGWAGRHHGAPPVGIGAPAASSATRPASPASTATPGTASPSAAPTASAPASQGPSAAPTPTPGPKLSSQSYAQVSFLVWPGTPSQAARAAETGLTISVHKQASGIAVAAAVAGHPLPAARSYPTGAKVWVIESSMGDDSGNTDFNLGDDGLIVTDAQGRILQ
jgi:hypothetical protein